MTDTKISAESLVTPYKRDYFPFVTASGPTTNRVLWETLMNGWVEVDDTWTYASATTITVPTNATTTYNKGDKIRLKQGGAYKYFYIVTVAATLLTITGGSDYTLANSAITTIAYSKGENPLDFPDTFSYTSTTSGSTGSIGTYAETVGCSFFGVKGKQCHLTIVKQITNKGSWATNVRVLLPVTPASPLSVSVANYFMGVTVVPNASITPRGIGRIDSGSSVISFEKTLGTAFLTWADISTNDWIIIDATYTI